MQPVLIRYPNSLVSLDGRKGGIREHESLLNGNKWKLPVALRLGVRHEVRLGVSAKGLASLQKGE